MNNKRNQRLNQVSEKTLIIGIDIAKRTHYACAVDYRGFELSKPYSFKQSRAGFKQFLDSVLDLRFNHGKNDIIVGFEPTGHYWMNLAAFLTEHDIRFVMVNPMHVNRTKELDDNLQTKNDQKDARLIAKLITNGNFSFPRLLEGIEAELRQGSALRNSLNKKLTSVKNEITRWVDRYFPEFSTIYKSYGKNACAILRQTPLPIDVVDTVTEDLVNIYRETENLSYTSKPKLEKLKQAAHHSIGITEGAMMARSEIKVLIDQLTQLESQLEEVNNTLTKLAKQLPDYELLMSIPGIGENTVSELLAETGSLRQYKSPRQLIKLAGLTLRENSSGQQKGQKRISKRGRRKLRALLYRAVLPLIQNNQVFNDLYQYYINREVNPLRKKESMVIICSKLLKIFHGLVQNKVAFDARKMRDDLQCLPEVS